MYAEAKNEATGPSQDIVDALNLVRQRAGINMPPISSITSKDDLRAAIRHERRVELAGEGLRFFDIKRWKIAHTIIPQLLIPGSVTSNTPTGIKRVFNQKQYLWPIPQSEIDLNKLIEQNPGY